MITGVSRVVPAPAMTHDSVVVVVPSHINTSAGKLAESGAGGSFKLNKRFQPPSTNAKFPTADTSMDLMKIGAQVDRIL